METLEQDALLTPVARRPSLAAIVTERIRASIMEAELPLGSIVSEDKLAARLGVSRTPVREALTALALQGLIVIQPQRGSFVFLPSADDIAELCEFRMMMETHALVLSHTRVKAETLEALQRANGAMAAALRDENPLASARADATFHEALFDGCGNKHLVQAYSLVSGRIGALRSNLLHPDDVRMDSMAEHEQIVAAFAANDLLRAESVLSAHIFRMRERYATAQSRFMPKRQLPKR